MSFSSVLTGGGFPGLLQWIRANETSGATFADSGGGGHSLPIPAGVTLNQTGVTGDGDKAVTFGGTASSLATASWMNITGSWWCVFFIRTSTTGSERHLFSRYTNNTNLMFSVGVSSTNKAIVRIRTSIGVTATGTTTVTDGAAHMGVATWDGSTLRLYVDGNSTPEGTGVASGTISTGQSVRWGSGYGASTWLSGDLMDDVAWGGGAGVPSGSDVAALYAAVNGATSMGATTGSHTSGGSADGVVGTVASATGAHTSGGTTGGRVDTTTGATGAATAGGTAGGTVAKSTDATGAHTTAASGDGAVVAGLSGDADGDVSAGGSATGFVARSTTATDSTTAGGTAVGTAGFSGTAAAAETSGGTATGATGATSSATGAHTAGGSAGGMLGLARDAATGVHTVGGSTAGSVTGAGSTIRFADGTTLINPRYADGTTLIVRGWLDADGVTIHPFT